MKNLIIIGAGGMGRTVYSNALESIGYGKVFVVKGFIDDNQQALDGFHNYPPVIGSIRDYQPQEDDVFVSSIGGAARRPCMEEIISRGGEFMELIHQTARILTNAKLGKGNFVGAYTVIGNDAVVGDYNMIQAYTVIGHDARIGSWNRIDTHVTCGGPKEFIDEHNGILIPVEDADALSTAMTEMYNDHSKFNSAQIRKDCMSRFAPDVIAKQLTEIFEEMVTRKSQKSQI